MPPLVWHVVHDHESLPGDYQHSRKLRKHLVRMEDAAAEMRDEYIDRLRVALPEIPGIQAPKTRLVVGHPVTRLLEVAKNTGACTGDPCRGQ